MCIPKKTESEKGLNSEQMTFFKTNTKIHVIMAGVRAMGW